MSEYLKCDVEGCGHIEHLDAITEAHVGSKCPSCGANLLTHEDWVAWRPIQAIMKAAAALSAKMPDEEGDVQFNVSVHGSRTTIEIDRGHSGEGMTGCVQDRGGRRS